MKVFRHYYTAALGLNRKCEIEIITRNDEHDGIPVVIAPGFLTQNSEDWLTYVAKHIDAPIIYVKWRSSSILKIATGTLLGTISTFAMPAIGTIRTMGFLSTILSSWSSAAREANLAGEELAIFLNSLWYDDDKAIFIGHSLGVRVITKAMEKLTHDNVLTSISIAGAVNKDDYDKRIESIKSPRAIKHSNLYSTNDTVLKWFYRIGEFNLKKMPIGLVCSDLKNVENYINNIGHTEYHDEISFGETLVKLHKEALDSFEI